MRLLTLRAVLVAAVCWLLGGPGLASGVILVDDPPACQEELPDVAALPGGGFVAVWQAGAEDAAPGRPRIFARLFDVQGAALGPALQVNGDYDALMPKVAVGDDGHFLVVWAGSAAAPHSGLSGRLFASSGAPLAPEARIASFYPEGGLAVTATGPSGFAVVGANALGVSLWTLGPAGPAALGSTVVLDAYDFPPGDVDYDFVDPDVAYGPGGLVATWALEADEDERSILARTVWPQLGEVKVIAERLGLDPEYPYKPRPAIAMDAASERVLIAWNELAEPPADDGVPVVARIFGPDLTPLVARFRIEGLGAVATSAPQVEPLRSGGFLVAWQVVSALPGNPSFNLLRRVDTRGTLGPPVTASGTANVARPALAVDGRDVATIVWQPMVRPPSGPGVNLCFSQGLHAERHDFASGLLQLQQGRFEARIHWTDHAGNTGEGRAVPLSDDSGYLWFFGPDNVEVMVKVLDGRGVNEHFWVFYASLTDVAFTLTVTDTALGRTRTYENPAGRLASSADTTAFQEGPPPPGRSTVAAPSHLPGEGASPAGPCTDPSLPVVRRPGLCLGGRFEVEAAWHATGTTGDAEGVRLTADSGSLWFFGQSNIELVVKVLDGRAVNGRFWVFYGALTDVEYTLLVRDTVTGQVRTYHNPAGQLRSRADTAAF